MPLLPAVFPNNRFYARLEKFQCACPSCGRLMTSHQDQGHLSKHLLYQGEKPTTAKYRRRARTITAARQLAWNPYTQRLTCPWCHVSFVAGLLLYPVGQRGKGHDTPPDAAPSYAERMELRRLAEGWCSQEEYARDAPVNVYVPEACSCPAEGWAQECALHGKRWRGEPTEGTRRRG